MSRRGLTIVEVLLATALAATVVASGVRVLRMVPERRVEDSLQREPQLERAIDAFFSSSAGQEWAARRLTGGEVELGVISATAGSTGASSVAFTVQATDDGSRWVVFTAGEAVALRWLSDIEAPE